MGGHPFAVLEFELTADLTVIEERLQHVSDRPRLEALRLVPVERTARRPLDRLEKPAIVGGDFERASVIADDDCGRDRKGVEQASVVRRHKVRSGTDIVRPPLPCRSRLAVNCSLHAAAMP